MQVRGQRADARANREKLLDAAGALFAERGIDAPLHEVSDRAGVGIATLYRNFPDRDALIRGLAGRIGFRFAEIAEAAGAATSGWEAVVTWIDGGTAMYLDWPWLVAVRDYLLRKDDFSHQWEPAVRSVVEAAQAEGALRADIDAGDLAFVPSLLSGLVYLPEPVRSVVVRRQRDIILDGLRTAGLPRQAPGAQVVPAEVFRPRH